MRSLPCLPLAASLKVDAHCTKKLQFREVKQLGKGHTACTNTSEHDAFLYQFQSQGGEAICLKC